jgi:hypothetical protein
MDTPHPLLGDEAGLGLFEVSVFPVCRCNSNAAGMGLLPGSLHAHGLAASILRQMR